MGAPARSARPVSRLAVRAVGTSLPYFPRGGADGDTWARAKSSGPFTLLSAGNNNTRAYQYPIEIDANASIVYWNWNAFQSTDGLFSAHADGGGFTTVDSGSSFGWGALRVDELAVYYFRAGAPIERLK